MPLLTTGHGKEIRGSRRAWRAAIPFLVVAVGLAGIALGEASSRSPKSDAAAVAVVAVVVAGFGYLRTRLWRRNPGRNAVAMTADRLRIVRGDGEESFPWSDLAVVGFWPGSRMQAWNRSVYFPRVELFSPASGDAPTASVELLLIGMSEKSAAAAALRAACEHHGTRFKAL